MALSFPLQLTCCLTDVPGLPTLQDPSLSITLQSLLSSQKNTYGFLRTATWWQRSSTYFGSGSVFKKSCPAPRIYVTPSWKFSTVEVKQCFGNRAVCGRKKETRSAKAVDGVSTYEKNLLLHNKGTFQPADKKTIVRSFSYELIAVYPHLTTLSLYGQLIFVLVTGNSITY